MKVIFKKHMWAMVDGDGRPALWEEDGSPALANTRKAAESMLRREYSKERLKPIRVAVSVAEYKLGAK